jgi:16S rRNA (adenine1518-N6/adenine1519-N6)-dimethyltransferase
MKNPVLDRMQRHGLRPRKELGQHFLVDQHAIERLVESIAPRPGDAILEFGAGPGVLTERLLEAGARVIAVELDDALAALLRQELGDRPGFRLVHADLARVDAGALRRELQAEHLTVVGNLPYQLTSHVLFGILDLEAHLDRAVFMIQREVAERIVAAPGNRTYGILSVLLRAYYDVAIVLRVKPGSFAPPPRVDSAVIRIVPRAGGPALPWDERAAFIHLVKSTFNERRKILRNTLRKFYDLDAAALDATATTSGTDLGRRPEELPVEAFVRLLHALPASATAMTMTEGGPGG